MDIVAIDHRRGQGIATGAYKARWHVFVNLGSPRKSVILELGIKYQVQRLKKSVDAPCFLSAF
jgi:hypothetical protein